MAFTQLDHPMAHAVCSALLPFCASTAKENAGVNMKRRRHAAAVSHRAHMHAAATYAVARRQHRFDLVLSHLAQQEGHVRRLAQKHRQTQRVVTDSLRPRGTPRSTHTHARTRAPSARLGWKRRRWEGGGGCVARSTQALQHPSTQALTSRCVGAKKAALLKTGLMASSFSPRKLVMSSEYHRGASYSEISAATACGVASGVWRGELVAEGAPWR